MFFKGYNVGHRTLQKSKDLLSGCSPSLVDGHDDLFQGGVACALANAVDGALDLPRARHCPGQAVGRRQAQVVLPQTAQSISALANIRLGPLASAHLISPPDSIANALWEATAGMIRKAGKLQANVHKQAEDTIPIRTNRPV